MEKTSMVVSVPEHIRKLGVPSGGASPLLMARHRQVINRISKGNQNMLFIITTFDCQCGSQGGCISVRAFALARLVWRHHWVFPYAASLPAKCRGLTFGEGFALNLDGFSYSHINQSLFA